MKNISPQDLRLGIVGGMGPAASNYFQDILVAIKNAPSDQANMPVICIANTKIPDRTAHLLDDTKPSPVPEMMQTIRDFEALKVFYAVITCNTAHAFWHALQSQTPLALLDMVKDTVHFATQMQTNLPHLKVGLLATNGTCATKIYHDRFKNHGIMLYTPDTMIQQKCVHASIYGDEKQQGIKGNELEKSAILLKDAISYMRYAHDINVVILGCTELPLVRDRLQAHFPDIMFIDPMEVIAQKAIEIHERALQIAHHDLYDDKKCKKHPLDLHSVDDYAFYIVGQALRK